MISVFIFTELKHYGRYYGYIYYYTRVGATTLVAWYIGRFYPELVTSFYV